MSKHLREAIHPSSLRSARAWVSSCEFTNYPVEAIPELKEEQITRQRQRSMESDLFRAKRLETLERRRRAEKSFVEFSIGFRKLPTEVKYKIFELVVETNCKETPPLHVGLRSRPNHADNMLYKLALRAYFYQNTFVLTRDNKHTVNQDLKGAMPSHVWKTIIHLEIKHQYMKSARVGFFRTFSHGAQEHSSFYSPCQICDYQAILLATNVKRLHLDFGDSYHCVMPSIERTCKLAIESMQLQRLELTVSNIWNRANRLSVGGVVKRINDATEKTGRLLSISTKRLSTGPYSASFASETWFWNAADIHTPLEWVENRAKNVADDAYNRGTADHPVAV